MRSFPLLLSLAALAACAGPTPEPIVTPDARASGPDAARPDGAAWPDARTADAPPADAPPADAQATDAQLADARLADARLADAPRADGAVADGRLADAPHADGPIADAAVPDAPVPVPDAAVPDAPVPLPDAATPDAAVPLPDAAVPDAAVPLPDAAVPDAAVTGGPVMGGCSVFPADDPWNQDVSGASVDATWTQKLIDHRQNSYLHPDFSTEYGIPLNIVPENQPKVTVNFDNPEESDPSPYPFPPNAKIEGGSDSHVLVVEQGKCLLWEAYACSYSAASHEWNCGSGALWDLNKLSPGQRSLHWTSADAAGLAIAPGLVRYDEVAAGAVKHAIRFTMHCTQDGFVYPASHQAVPPSCLTSIGLDALRSDYPPMGLRIRLKASYSIDGLRGQAKIIAQAMKTYGMILADNGSDYYFTGENNPGWNDDELEDLKTIPAEQFEVLTPGAIHP